MKYTEIALKVLAAKECGIFKTNSQFWLNYSNVETFNNDISNDIRIINKINELQYALDLEDKIDGIVCIYDDCFPIINRMVKNNGDKPYLLLYKGDLTLLNNLNNNVAVIGVIDIDNDIENRESEIVKRLVDKNLTIVSGLAIGCDTIAHKIAIESNGKTIAVLPTQISKIYPTENKDLAEEIVNKGGLLISEYYKESNSKMESISRFIERDRLQAMFSKAIILIASYRKDEGDSGSRHAMKYASKYGIDRFVMYNSKTDLENKKFGLNKDFLSNDPNTNINILLPSSIEFIKTLVNPNLIKLDKQNSIEQISFL